MLSFRSRMTQGLLVAALMATALPSSGQPKPKPKPAASASAPKAAAPTLSESLTGMAKAEYEAAKVLVEVNDYQNALVKFQHAYDLSNDYRLLWNVAVCETQLRHYSRAQAVLVRYREQGADKLTPEELNRVAALDKDTLAKYISTVQIEVNEPGATIFVDGENVGTSPLEKPIRVDVGKRVFRFEKPGYRTVIIEQTMTGGSAVTVTATLEVSQGKLIVEAGPKDAIMLDGKTVGLGRFEGGIPSGGHTLRVTAPGMIAFQTEVQIEDNKDRRFTVKLDPLPKQVDLAKWGWIGGGTALVIGSVIAGALMFTPTNAPVTQGSLGTFPLSFGGRP